MKVDIGAGVMQRLGKAFIFINRFRCLSESISVLRSLTAVGYGRISPVTTVGRGLAMVTGIVGTFYMAMPLSIVGTKFYDIYGRLNELVSKKTRKLKNLAMFAGLLKRSAVKNHHHDLLDQYKNDIEEFCRSKALYSVETVDRASVAETQVGNHVSYCCFPSFNTFYHVTLY